MAEDLKLKVVADVSDLLSKMAASQKSVNDLEVDLKELKAQAVKTYDPTEIVKYNTQIANLEANIKKIKSASDSSMGAVVKGSERGTQALTDLGRIAQDVPFGFVGIQNNISPLVESFGRLKTETGSVKGAFGALISSLTGPAGFGLAISLVTAAITFATTGFGAWTRAFGSSSKEIEKAKAELSKFNEEIDKAKGKAAETGIKLQAYIDVAKNSANTDKERKAALSEANKIMGEYGEKITLANVATERITKQTLQFVEALRAQAIAQVFGSRLGESIGQQEDALTKLTIANKEYNKVYDQTKALQQKAIPQGDDRESKRQAASAGEQLRAVNQTLLELDIKRTEAQNNYLAATGKVNAIQSRYGALIADQVKKQTELGVKEKENAKERKTLTEADIIAQLALAKEQASTQLSTGLIDEKKFANEIQSAYIKAIDDLVKIGQKGKIPALELEFTQFSYEQIIKNAKRASGSEAIEVPAEIKPKFEKTDQQKYLEDLSKFLTSAEYKKVIAEGQKFGVTAPLDLVGKSLDNKANFDPQKLKEYNDQITAVKENLATIGSVVSSIGQPFQELFTNLINGSQNAFEAFGNAIKQILVKMAAAAITAAILSVIIAPFLGASASSGVKAAFSMKGLFSMVSGLKLANGGYVSGAGTSRSDSIPAMLSNGEFVMNAAAVNRIGRQNLQSMNNGQSIGGGLNANINITGQPMLRGADIYFSLKQTEKTIGRNG